MQGMAGAEQREMEQALSQLGASFSRISGYFREDGVHCVSAVEQAMRARDAKAMVMPAHRLKGEARQLGARRLGDLAETIEMGARACIERRTGPEEMIADIAELRPCFDHMLAMLDRIMLSASAGAAGRRSPLAGFGRRRSVAATLLSGLSRP